MSAFFYYLATATESALSVFGIRAPYEQPKYDVVGELDGGIELRAYHARTAAETPMRNGNDGEAFGRLFRYITGANTGRAHIAMTIPVQMTPQRIAPLQIAMTVPVEQGGDGVMRFFLPDSVVKAGAPAPTDPLVHIVTLPPQTFAVLRFSGTITQATREAHEAALIDALTKAGKAPEGAPSILSYDPPFAIPFLRRNEVVVRLKNV
jgi:hypothetical protein